MSLATGLYKKLAYKGHLEAYHQRDGQNVRLMAPAAARDDIVKSHGQPWHFEADDGFVGVAFPDELE